MSWKTSDIVNVLIVQQKMVVLPIITVLVMTGCAIQKKEESQQEGQSGNIVKNTAALNEELEQRDSEVARLQLKLLEKQAEINQLVLSLQYAIQEVVRTKAKLRSHSSKAETVANLAEVKMALKSVEAGPMNEQQRRVVHQAGQMILMSNEALEAGNIDGASYLSNRAHQLIRPISVQQRDQKRSEKSGAEVVFVTPLKVNVLKRCNVRKGPGLGEDVLFKLDSGTSVKALAYAENWVQIEDENKGRGWVYFQLLGIAQ